MKLTKRLKTRLSLVGRVAALATVATLSVAHSPAARAETMLKAATTLVVGTSADTYSITAPGAGTLTAAVSSVPWPTALSALSFNLTDASTVLTPTAQPLAQALTAGSTTQPLVGSYQVGPGTYFAHVSASATGALNMGLYSALFTFTPSAVPLPTTAALLLIGLLGFWGLRRVHDTAGAVDSSAFGHANV